MTQVDTEPKLEEEKVQGAHLRSDTEPKITQSLAILLENMFILRISKPVIVVAPKIMILKSIPLIRSWYLVPLMLFE